MIARLQKSIDEKDKGFTLIELLVVMIIIGILAAIAIPVFLSQRQKARDTSTKADISTIGKEIATYWIDGTTAAGAAVTQAGGKGTTVTAAGSAINVSNGTLVTASSATSIVSDTAWCVQATNADGKVQTYSYSADKGLRASACVGSTNS